MMEVYKEFPDDPEVAFARVDATMVLKPWKLWDLKTGTPTPEAEEIRPVIEASLLKWPQHPGLCHLYVHLMEMSPEPQAALPTCDFLRSMNTDAGHLIHMATHIDVLVGDYRSGVDSNLKALQSDYRCINFGGGGNAGSFYAGYISHNCHMMVYSAMLGCMEDDAMKAVSMVNDFMNEQLLTDFPQRQDHQECFYPQKKSMFFFVLVDGQNCWRCHFQKVKKLCATHGPLCCTHAPFRMRFWGILNWQSKKRNNL